MKYVIQVAKHVHKEIPLTIVPPAKAITFLFHQLANVLPNVLIIITLPNKQVIENVYPVLQDVHPAHYPPLNKIVLVAFLSTT